MNDNNTEKKAMYAFEDMKREQTSQNIADYINDCLISEITAYREIFNITQRNLSKMSGVTQAVISQMEQGNKTPKLATLAKLINALNLDVEIKVSPRKNNGKLEQIDQDRLKKMVEAGSKIIANLD